MKKTLYTGALCAATLLSTPSFAADQELYFYNWSEYIPNEVLEDFTEETGIK
ncbi:spermidine/putrescine ABC transporter substrate-binding protein PotD, partial [Vibrio lentus]